MSLAFLNSTSRILPPVVILVRPQMGENIGAVARAMSNFGLRELRIVAPRDGWPNPKANEMAAGAETIITEAKIFPDFKAALADVHLAYATTARPRDMEKRVVTPDMAMAEIINPVGGIAEAQDPAQHAFGGSQDKKIALVFGPERSGLENEDISWCDTLITIPTAPENWSLNLAQGVVIVGYEWFRQASGFRIQDSGSKDSRPPESLATKEELAGMFDQLESYLDAADYFRVEHKKPLMWQNLRTMLMRGAWSAQEVRTFRGVLRSLWERNG